MITNVGARGAKPAGYGRSVPVRARTNPPTVELSNFVVGLVRHHAGRGPTRARTQIGEKVLTVLLEDVMTTIEQTLARTGRDDLVRAARAVCHEAMAAELIEGVEEITGRSVRECMSAVAVDSDVIVITFLLKPPQSSASDGAFGGTDRVLELRAARP